MPPTLRNRNGIIYLDNTPLTTEALQETYLIEAAALGETQLFVQSIEGLADNQLLWIEDAGIGSAELVSINGTPTVAGGVVLDSALSRSHSNGSKVYVIAFNQVELTHATTATGSKTALTTTLGSGLVSLLPNQKVQRYNETEFTSGYYFARYKNSITSSFGSYSDALVYGGWDTNTFGYILEQALRDNDETLSKKITKQDCFAWGTKCLKEMEGKQLRWPEHYSYNQVLGQTSRGVNVITMPTDAYDTESAASLLRVAIGDQDSLQYLDPTEFDLQQGDVKVTQVTTQAVAAQTTLEIDNSYDFEDSGTVSVYISGTKYSITYTGVTRSSTAGILTGIPASGDGSISVTIAVDIYVWQDEEEGTPNCFTVRNGNLEWYPLVDANLDNQNVYGDYAKVATAINSDGDTIDYHRYDAVQAYLTWRVWCKAKNNGQLDQNNGFYSQYKEALNDAIRTLPVRRTKMMPNINRMSRVNSSRRPNIQLLSNSDQ